MYLICQPETLWNQEGRIEGRNDTPLSKKGEEQVLLLGEIFSHHPIQTVHSSPLSRAKALSLCLSKKCNCAHHEHNELTEQDMGSSVGMTYGKHNELFSKKKSLFYAQHVYKRMNTSIHDEETHLSVAERLLPLLHTIHEKNPKESIVIMHPHALRITLTLIGQYDEDAILIKNGAIIELFWKEGRWNIFLMEGVSVTSEKSFFTH